MRARERKGGRELTTTDATGPLALLSQPSLSFVDTFESLTDVERKSYNHVIRCRSSSLAPLSLRMPIPVPIPVASSAFPLPSIVPVPPIPRVPPRRTPAPTPPFSSSSSSILPPSVSIRTSSSVSPSGRRPCAAAVIEDHAHRRLPISSAAVARVVMARGRDEVGPSAETSSAPSAATATSSAPPAS